MVKKMPNIFERDVERISNLSFSNGKAVIYTRISSKNQKDGHSFESQQKICEDYCFDNNFDIIEILFETTSAKNITNQKVLKNILERHSNIHLVVNDASRFSRNFKDAVVVLDTMMKKNIILHCAEKNLVCSNNMDFKNIVSDFKDAEIEIQNLSKRIRRTIQFKKSNKTFLPSVPKYGTKYIKMIEGAKIKVKIENDPIEQKIISLINLMYYGSPSLEIEKLLKDITGNKSHRLYDYVNENEINEVKYGNFRKIDIANFLNYINIFKRGRKWSSSMISHILDLSE